MSVKFKPNLIKNKCQIKDIPGDKSISHRAIIIGSLASNISTYHNFLCAQDCLNTATIFKALGVDIKINLQSKTVTIVGVGLHGLKKPTTLLDVGNSGTGIRLITGILAAQPFESTISGDHSIIKRPMKRIIEPLSLMGAEIDGQKQAQKTDIYPPLNIKQKKLTSINYSLPVASAQVKSAILFASLFAEGTTAIHEPIKCRDHTEVMLSTYGANIKIDNKKIFCDGSKELKNPFTTSIAIPADFSSAAFFIILALVTENTVMTLKNIGLNPTRARLLTVLKDMGASIEITSQKGIEPYGDIKVSSSKLTNIAIAADDIPFIIDEIPILAVAAMFATGKMIVTNAEELRVKESDRIKSTVELVEQFGGQIEEFEDGFILTGGCKPIKPEITTYYDHRIAMSAIIAATASKVEILLDNIDAIQTSFPSFLSILETISIKNKPE